MNNWRALPLRYQISKISNPRKARVESRRVHDNSAYLQFVLGSSQKRDSEKPILTQRWKNRDFISQRSSPKVEMNHSRDLPTSQISSKTSKETAKIKCDVLYERKGRIYREGKKVQGWRIKKRGKKEITHVFQLSLSLLIEKPAFLPHMRF